MMFALAFASGHSRHIAITPEQALSGYGRFASKTAVVV
jgi:hypothetical protein